MSGLALSPRPATPRLSRAPAAQPDILAIERGIVAIEEAVRGHRELDALIYRGLGWEVVFDKAALRRGWRCRSPLSALWQTLPAPSTVEDEAARLVPFGWSRGSGVMNRRPFAWTAPRWPVQPGVPFFECNGASTALALSKAALHAHRWRALQDPAR